MRFVGLRFILSEMHPVMVNRPLRECAQMNPILNAFALYLTRGQGAPMPVQRRVFRIEESARPRAGERDGGAASGRARSTELMSELASLRTLIERPGLNDREMGERAQAQIAEARAFKHELELIHSAVEQSRDQMRSLGAATLEENRAARAGRELAEIVTGTERATQSILQAAEEIDHAAGTMLAALRSGHDKGLAHDIQDRVVQIFEACNFQDLTAQRVAHAVETLTFVERHAALLLEIWQRIETVPPAFEEQRQGDRRYLNGPKLVDDRGHFSQNDIDVMFG
jgi:chemotaxis protein CheZ